MLSFEFAGATEPGAETIVFLHGGSYSRLMWHVVVEKLPQYRAFLVDLPGHGGSIAIPFKGFEDAADHVAALLAKEHPAPIHVAGLSLGAYAGLCLCERHRALVRRAALSGFHMGAFPNPRRNRALAMLLAPIAVTGWFRRKAARSMAVDPDTILPGASPPPVSMRALVGVLDAALRWNPSAERLAAITTPILVLAGEREHSAILGSLGPFKAALPNAEAYTAPGLGHAWSAQDPALFAQTLDAWFAGTELPGTLIAA